MTWHRPARILVGVLALASAAAAYVSSTRRSPAVPQPVERMAPKAVLDSRAAVLQPVRENDVQLCKLGSGTFCTVQVPAGTHQYDVHTEAKDRLSLEVKPGETYYVISSISMGAFAGHPKLTVTDKATFDGMKDKLKDNTGKDLAGKDDK